MIRMFDDRAGFALPTILIASMIMLIVLITSVSATASVRSGLDGQYYTQLAREAAESGLARANGCLQDSGYVPAWSSSVLYPNTSCSGGNPCTNTASCFVTSRSTLRTTFSVQPPEDQSVAQIVRAEGKVELIRASNGEVWRTYTYIASSRVGADVNFGTVAFGYAGGSGGYFATITADGSTRATGYNGNGQLGNGTTSNTTSPTKFKLPGSERASSIYTNFLSGGYNMSVLTRNGDVYSAGSNSYGQLGDGTTTSPRSNPVKYNLPAGVKAKYVNVSAYNTYVLGSDNNLYATGWCGNGLIGSNYTISGCANRSTYIRVNLPTVNTSNLNTIPSTNIVNDYLSTFVRMQGGQVWAWGDNGHDQFGTSSIVQTSNPTQIGSFGNANQPKAIDIQTDGISLWVVDDTGKAWAAGYNYYGELGGGNTEMSLDSLGECLDNTSGNGTSVQFYPCNSTSSQWWTWRNDQSIYNAATGKCLNVAADNVAVNLTACNGTTAQRWVMQDTRVIRNTQSSKCLNNQGNDGVTVIVYTCGAYTNEYFYLQDKDSFNAVNLPGGSGSVVKVATDQWATSLLTSTGEVYSFGANAVGNLGSGNTLTFQPAPVKFILPSGVTAKDVTVTGYGGISGSRYYNTFVVGSDGKVYGAGSNYFGQLGDGSTTNRSTPVAMNVINGTTIRAKQVLAGNGTTVILTEDKRIYTVGNNANGELGDGSTVNNSNPQANRYTNVLPVTSF